MVTELAGKNAEVARLTQEGNAKATEIATLKCSL